MEYLENCQRGCLRGLAIGDALEGIEFKSVSLELVTEYRAGGPRAK